MSLINLGLILNGIITVGVGFLVLFRNHRNKINITFAVATFCLGLWSFGGGMFREATTESTAFF